MPLPSDLSDPLIATWRTTNRVTVFLLENLPAELWSAKVLGASRRTVRMIAGHIPNARCMWIKMVGRDHEADGVLYYVMPYVEVPAEKTADHLPIIRDFRAEIERALSAR